MSHDEDLSKLIAEAEKSLKENKDKMETNFQQILGGDVSSPGLEKSYNPEDEWEVWTKNHLKPDEPKTPETKLTKALANPKIMGLAFVIVLIIIILLVGGKEQDIRPSRPVRYQIRNIRSSQISPTPRMRVSPTITYHKKPTVSPRPKPSPKVKSKTRRKPYN